MIDPLFKKLETLRQVYPQGLTVLVAPEGYEPENQWVFNLNNTKDVERDLGIDQDPVDPQCGYRFVRVKTNEGFSYRTGQEALEFVRIAPNFSIERFSHHIDIKLAEAHHRNGRFNYLIEQAYPDWTIDELYRHASQTSLVRARIAAKMHGEATGQHVELITPISLVKELPDDKSPSDS